MSPNYRVDPIPLNCLHYEIEYPYTWTNYAFLRWCPLPHDVLTYAYHRVGYRNILWTDMRMWDRRAALPLLVGFYKHYRSFHRIIVQWISFVNDKPLMCVFSKKRIVLPIPSCSEHPCSRYPRRSAGIRPLQQWWMHVKPYCNYRLLHQHVIMDKTAIRQQRSISQELCAFFALLCVFPVAGFSNVDETILIWVRWVLINRINPFRIVIIKQNEPKQTKPVSLFYRQYVAVPLLWE